MNARDLKEGDTFTNLHCIVLKKEGKTNSKNEKYVDLDLRALDGTVFEGAKRWDYDRLPIAKVIACDGLVISYNNRPQLKIKAWSASELPIEDFTPKAPWSLDGDDQWSLLEKHISSIDEGWFEQVEHFISWCERFNLEAFRSEEKELRSFKDSTGAKGVHHAYRHGLIEHTVEVVAQAFDLADLYGLSLKERRLLMIGAAIHDIGKMFEYDQEDGIYSTADIAKPYQEKKFSGGHTYIGSQLLTIYHALEAVFSDEDYPVLQNIILSHHGRFSPVRPSYLISAIVHHADTTSADISRMKYALATTDKDEVAGDAVYQFYLRL